MLEFWQITQITQKLNINPYGLYPVSVFTLRMNFIFVDFIDVQIMAIICTSIKSTKIKFILRVKTDTVFAFYISKRNALTNSFKKL